MTYDGKVSVGGPAQTRDLPSLTITKVAVGSMNNNAYLLKCKNTGDQLLIDAASEPSTLLTLIRAGGSLEKIVTTHQHWDHVGALEALAKETGADTVAHVEDAPALPLAPSDVVLHEDTIDVGDCVLKVIHLRGHTPGSIALLYDAGGELAGSPHLFTGDSLFPGGPGNTDHDAQRFNSLITDLENRIFADLPDGTWVYPGHGGDTTLGAERPHLAEWRARGW